MQVRYVCGCKQVMMLSGMLANRDCYSCNLPVSSEKVTKALAEQAQQEAARRKEHEAR